MCDTGHLRVRCGRPWVRYMFCRGPLEGRRTASRRLRLAASMPCYAVLLAAMCRTKVAALSCRGGPCVACSGPLSNFVGDHIVKSGGTAVDLPGKVGYSAALSARMRGIDTRLPLAAALVAKSCLRTALRGGRSEARRFRLRCGHCGAIAIR